MELLEIGGYLQICRNISVQYNKDRKLYELYNVM